MEITNTPYDDVFRTLLNDCSSLIIPVINEVFGESYTGDERIVFSPNEHFLNREDGQEKERIPVLKSLEQKQKNIRKGVKSVMGGKILEYEAKTIKKEGLQEGLREGLQEGLQKGRLEMLFDLVRDNLLTIKDAASQAKLTEETFKEKMLNSNK